MEFGAQVAPVGGVGILSGLHTLRCGPSSLDVVYILPTPSMHALMNNIVFPAAPFLIPLIRQEGCIRSPSECTERGLDMPRIVPDLASISLDVTSDEECIPVLLGLPRLKTAQQVNLVDSVVPNEIPNRPVLFSSDLTRGSAAQKLMVSRAHRSHGLPWRNPTSSSPSSLRPFAPILHCATLTSNHRCLPVVDRPYRSLHVDVSPCYRTSCMRCLNAMCWILATTFPCGWIVCASPAFGRAE